MILSSDPLPYWKIHRGNNRFFFNGKCMISWNVVPFLLTFILTCTTIITSFVYDIPFIYEKMGIAIPLCNAVLSLLVIASLCKTTFTDPGIIPRATPAEVSDEEQFNQCYGMQMKIPSPKTHQFLNHEVTSVLTTTVHGSLPVLEGEKETKFSQLHKSILKEKRIRKHHIHLFLSTYSKHDDKKYEHHFRNRFFKASS
ncbi:putative palmitoyltransferase ZDHHC14 [Trichinella pseudospiralis]|uniref:Putative palmitoyltransferase ZDHHC14 n=1 Tax=Trichinella pseudospiralis TaxID=6337 RepID=A0A0V1J3P6_TRIPS|nr:putative palmitoyltransferase ZDHHC14 [Trichinella pseudospiralis]KRZ29638.1 putative palmitoyltransferase ZDHHC14 [Trichinella pseudospiralis]KRZ36789.1 putative palmitoyltransferase ZDHHC14 [Trichinella pseudospiralis]